MDDDDARAPLPEDDHPGDAGPAAAAPAAYEARGSSAPAPSSALPDPAAVRADHGDAGNGDFAARTDSYTAVVAVAGKAVEGAAQQEVC